MTIDSVSITSVSPSGRSYECHVDMATEERNIDNYLSEAPDQPCVVIQGLGFVGTAMAAAVSLAKQVDQRPQYKVIGVDVASADHYWKIAALNEGVSPVVSADASLQAAITDAKTNHNIYGTYSPYAYSRADIVVIDVNLDVHKDPAHIHNYELSNVDGFCEAITQVAKQVREDALVIVETTVPPGFTEQTIFPIFDDHFKQRGLDITKLGLCHSYERVMPGPHYLKSITDFYRVFSGLSAVASTKARSFFESFINTHDYPLVELESPTASEMSKVLENSYRAANIALIQEWTRFAQSAKVNLYDIIKAIRMRPTHQNIMLPGFGVGGYCLTKDALLADWSNQTLFQVPSSLGLSLEAIHINDHMPEYTFELMTKAVGDVSGKAITILGVSYAADVSDTRYSPTERFYDLCVAAGARVHLHDPLVSYWPEKQIAIKTDVSALNEHAHDIVVLATRHAEYVELDSAALLAHCPGASLIVDGNNIVTDAEAQQIRDAGVRIIGVGKGHWDD